MKILYYDCFCGISGDMNLAALIDLGVSKEYLIKELSKLNLNSEYEIKVERAAKLGITGTRVDVILKDELNDEAHILEQALHEHSHEHYHHNGDEHHHEDSNH
ncbi:nickel insertion protein, partial [uncultured Clostridium sp.]|uniref:nickel insertion protein n=1 Tax=uncultured Clostridium sp. TaxID=59620 RepID=UPI0028EA8A46